MSMQGTNTMNDTATQVEDSASKEERNEGRQQASKQAQASMDPMANEHVESG